MFVLIYKLLTYILIFLIFINLSNNLYYESEHRICSKLMYSPIYPVNKTTINKSVYINIYNIFNQYSETSDRDHNFFYQQYYKQSVIISIRRYSTW